MEHGLPFRNVRGAGEDGADLSGVMKEEPGFDNLSRISMDFSGQWGPI